MIVRKCTTNTPTINPTNEPTNEPTIVLTSDPTAIPSSNPFHYLVRSGAVQQTLSPTQEAVEVKDVLATVMILIFVGLFCCCSMLIFIVLCIYFKQKSKLLTNKIHDSTSDTQEGNMTAGSRESASMELNSVTVDENTITE